MRDIRRLGLVDYFRKVIEYNVPVFTAPYDHQSLYKWTEAEISQAKKLALTDWLIEKVKSNANHGLKGTGYPHLLLMRSGWTESEIKSAVKAVPLSKLKSLLYWVLLLAGGAALVYYTYIVHGK